ncbi:unnamed protein product [Lepeophtheirus salmonis]|uniref:(salmon louse) hypothetical protein n=1 Tax=Lepeophtheirus salmonis TaxID=72036 RepID=A0A7R8H9Y6_LEPSM|nr:unnamed protein product [Lepeophtheirus salmonis]CAF2968271.1 unnamed protein product [Lepeophtheirus salmonis]
MSSLLTSPMTVHFLVVWQSVFTGLSLLANIGSLTSLLLKRNSPRLFKAYLLILLLQLSHISLVKVPLVYTLWWSSGSYPFGPQLCTASCIIDFALPSAILVFTTSGAFIGLQACIRDSSRTTCFGYFAQKKEARKYSDWIVSIGTNGFSIISVIFAGTLSFFRGSPYWDKSNLQQNLSFGILAICSTTFVNIPRSVFYFYIPPSSSETAKEFALYVLTRLFPDSTLLFIPLGLLLLSRNLQESSSSNEEELRHLIDTNCPIVLMERLAHSQTTMV